MTAVQTSAPHAQAIGARSWIGPALALAVMGWGANQFAPLIVLYQQERELTSAVLNGIFGLYALGLIPALFVGGRLSDRIGRRPVILGALVVSAVGTLVLLAGGNITALLAIGRTLSGLANGLAFGTGAAWVKELSQRRGDDAAAGPRRSIIAMTIGFAAGPFVSGLCAQWAPAPTVLPYLPHLLLLVAAACAIWRSPDPRRQLWSNRPTGADRTQTPDRARDRDNNRRAARHFVLVLLPFAPWVFGTAAVALAYLPSLVAPEVSGHAMAFSAVATGLTALAGIVAQPLVHRIHRPGSAQLLLISMGVVLAGLAASVCAAYLLSPWIILIASALLGIAYGFTQFCGLVEVQQITDQHTLGTATAVYQILSYIGFSFPFLLSVTGESTNLTPSTLLLIVSSVALACTAWLTIITRSQRTTEDDSWPM